MVAERGDVGLDKGLLRCQGGCFTHLGKDKKADIHDILVVQCGCHSLLNFCPDSEPVHLLRCCSQVDQGGVGWNKVAIDKFFKVDQLRYQTVTNKHVVKFVDKRIVINTIDFKKNDATCLDPHKGIRIGEARKP